MKKVLAVLLAVCLMAGLAVPAFAANPVDYDYSSEAGDFDEITALAFNAAEVVIVNGDSKDLANYLTAYVGDDKIAMDFDGLEWTISDSLAFGLLDSVVDNVGEDNGEAVVTVKVPETEIAASITVKAAANPNDPEKKVPATGFKFSESKYIGYATPSDPLVLQILPTNANGVFKDEQITVLTNALHEALAKAGVDSDNIADVNASTGLDSDLDDVYYGIRVQVKSATDTELIKLEMENVALPRFDKDGDRVYINNDTSKPAFYGAVDRTVKFQFKKAVEAKKVVRTKSVKIEVGQTANLMDSIAFTTGATYGKNVTWTLDFYNDNATSMDYATLKSWNNYGEAMILGVSVGKLKAVATLQNGNYVAVPVEVVARGTLTEATYAIEGASALKVGEKAELTLKKDNVAVENVTWTVSDAALATISADANPATVEAAAAGSVVVYARVGDEVVATAKIEITAAGNAATSNPQTGDSLFANLF